MTVDLTQLNTRASKDALAVLGTLNQQGQGIALLGPIGPEFWDHLQATPEFQDGAPDPVDRWSTRVIQTLAQDVGAEALFPFGGPPWHPFIAWAKASGRTWASPVTLLVHDTQGLMVSYRGALRFPQQLPVTDSAPSPCEICADRPCRTACPVHALGPDGYDVPACKAHVASPEGTACRTGGCLARRACPVSQAFGREEQQSAHHMGYFL